MLSNYLALVRFLPIAPLLCGLAFGQLPANNTTPDGQGNGRFWRSLGSSTSHAIYLAGYFQGFDQALTEMLDGTNTQQVLKVGQDIPKANTGETAEALDKFYADPENLNIPIWRAIRIAALKIAGRPRAEMDAEMDTVRSVLRNWWRDCDEKKIACEHLR